MVKQLIKYTCEVTGREYDSQEEALKSERVANAVQYLRDRVGLEETDAIDVLNCIKQRPDLFVDYLPAKTGNVTLPHLFNGPLRVSVRGPSGSGKGLFELMLHQAIGSTHDIKDVVTREANCDTYDIKLKPEEREE